MKIHSVPIKQQSGAAITEYIIIMLVLSAVTVGISFINRSEDPSQNKGNIVEQLHTNLGRTLQTIHLVLSLP